MEKIVKNLLVLFIIIIILVGATITAFAETKIVTPTKSKIFLDFEQVYFETYLIDGYNYFKLRDLAYAFNNTSKAFQVEWNGQFNRIDITLNKKYTALGTEMTDLNPKKEKKNAVTTSSEIYINGTKTEFKTYNIDGYNYFKLRDLLKVIDCGVTYDEKTQFINIYTAWSYVTDEYVKLPILMYHHIDYAADGTNNMIITPSKLENDIITIINKGYTPISLKELYSYVKDGTSLPQKPIVITFDDGYLSNYQYAFPILKKYNVKACIFPIIRYTEDIIADYPHFNYAQAKEMLESGLIEIQPHTYDMHSQIIDANAFYADILKAIDKLNRNLNINVYAFAFPYGKYNASLQKVLDQTAIKISLLTDEGINFVDKGDFNSLKLMKRYTVSQYTNLDVLLTRIENTERVGVK